MKKPLFLHLHVITILLATLSAFNTHAALMSVDDAIYGAGAITRDTVTGYEWLDLSLTANRSFATISLEFGTGGEFDGFQHASRDDVISFWSNFGIPNIDAGFNENNFAPINSLINLLGGPLNSGQRSLSSGLIITEDFTDLSGNISDSSGGFLLSARLDTQFNHSVGRPDRGRANSQLLLDGGIALPTTGHWIYRTQPTHSVPEPSVVSLICAALLVQLCLSRKKKLNQHMLR